MRGIRTLEAGPGVGADDRDRSVRAAAEALSAGAILVHPTETVYGLGALSPELDAEIGGVKGRSDGRPLLRIGPDTETVRRRHPGLAWCETADRLASAFWPGPLTLVLDDGSRHGLGVRVEGHPLTRRVLEILEETMSSTSLNSAGDEPAATPRHAREALRDLPEARVPVAWLEAGPLPGAPPSTLLSLRDAPPRLLRAGAIGRDRLERVLGRRVNRG